MKLKVWADSQGISYQTALRMYNAGTLPVPAYRTATGRIIVDLAGTGPDHAPGRKISLTSGCVIYARVSGHDQKDDLQRQIKRLRAHARELGLTVTHEVGEIGSGLNGHRPKLLEVLKNNQAGVILVEHRDRLMRYGFDYVEAALAAGGRSLIVLDDKEMQDDLVQDMVDFLTSCCARLYGRRSAGRRALAAAHAIHQEPERIREPAGKQARGS